MPVATLTATKPPKQEAPAASPDLTVIKARQKAAWASGNYAVVGTTLQIVGEELCEALDLTARERKCSTWLPATEMSVSPPRGAGATLFQRTTWRPCWSAAVPALWPKA